MNFFNPPAPISASAPRSSGHHPLSMPLPQHPGRTSLGYAAQNPNARDQGQDQGFQYLPAGIGSRQSFGNDERINVNANAISRYRQQEEEQEEYSRPLYSNTNKPTMVPQPQQRQHQLQLQDRQQQQQSFYGNEGVPVGLGRGFGSNSNSTGYLHLPVVEPEPVPPPLEVGMGGAAETELITGVVTQLDDGFGMISGNVFFMFNCVTGRLPAVGDKVIADAAPVQGMPFKFNAKRVQAVARDFTDLGISSAPASQSQPSIPSRTSESKKSPSKDKDRREKDRHRRRSPKKKRSRSRSRSRERRHRSRSKSPSRRKEQQRKHSSPKRSEERLRMRRYEEDDDVQVVEVFPASNTSSTPTAVVEEQQQHPNAFQRKERRPPRSLEAMIRHHVLPPAPIEERFVPNPFADNKRQDMDERERPGAYNMSSVASAETIVNPGPSVMFLHDRGFDFSRDIDSSPHLEPQPTSQFVSAMEEQQRRWEQEKQLSQIEAEREKIRREKRALEGEMRRRKKDNDHLSSSTARREPPRKSQPPDQTFAPSREHRGTGSPVRRLDLNNMPKGGRERVRERSSGEMQGFGLEWVTKEELEAAERRRRNRGKEDLKMVVLKDRPRW